MANFAELDNPIWFALTSGQADIARANGLARRFPGTVSPLAGVREPTPQAFADLHSLVGPKEGVGLFTSAPVNVPEDWNVVRARTIDQMICTELAASSRGNFDIAPLGEADIPEMLALTAATEPGPFLAETIRMGRYLGIRSEGKLAAMAGQRLRLGKFTEVSAVCTDLTFRGRGYALALVERLAGEALAEGKVPFLHVKSENGARIVYEKAGFRFRWAIHLTVLTPA